MAKKSKLLFSGTTPLAEFVKTPLGRKKMKGVKITRISRTKTGGRAYFGYRK
jgi:hypothetical protein